MNWVFFAALVVASSAAKLDRTYLPPASAESAGGSPGSLLAPLVKSEAQSLPIGSFVNEHDGVVVDVAPVGTRASQSGLGGPRISYGSTDSKVGDAAFRETLQGPPKFINNVPAALNSNPDLSAFHQPAKPSRTSFQISRDSGAHITKYHNDIDKDRYSYGFEADNGIKAEERGVITNGVQAEGGFSYVGDDGKVYSVAYTADTNGYRPVGSHLPTPPPIPAEILRALEQNSRDEAAGLSEDGSYDAQKYNTAHYTKTDANGKYNDRQTIKFSIRPESSPDTKDTYINQNQGAFIKPTINGGLEGTKDNTKPEPSKISQQINGFGINFNNRNNFNPGEMNLNAGIGSRNEFSQQKLQGSLSPHLGSSLTNKDNNSSIIPPKPLSQQDLQESINSGQDSPRPSSYDTSFSTVVSDNVLSKINIQPSQETVTSSASEEKKNQPIRFEHSFIKPTQGVFTQNFGLKNTESKLQAKPMNINIPVVSKFMDQNDSKNYFTTQTFHNQMKNKLNNRFSTSQSGPGTFNSFGFTQTTGNNDRRSGTSSFFPATKPVLPTKQPERILTTPFESFSTTNNAQSPTTLDINQEQYTDSKLVDFPELISTSKFTSIPFTQQEIKTTPFESFTTTNNAQTPTTFGINRKQYTGSNFGNIPGLTSTSKFTSIPSTPQEIKTKTTPQAQFPSTNYNEMKVSNSPFSFSQPSNNFDLQNQQYKLKENKVQTMSQVSSLRPNTINISQSVHNPSTNFIRTEMNNQKYPTTSSDQFDSGLISKQDTKFTEGNKDVTSSTYSQGTSGFNRQTNLSTLAPVSQTTVSKINDSYQANGITQASISPFPSNFPSSLRLKESNKVTFNPFHQTTQTNSQSQTQFFEPSKVTATGILQSSFTDQDNVNENSNSQTQQYNNKIYEYNKPLQSFSSAPGNVGSKPLDHLGTKFSKTTPFRVNEDVTSDQNEKTSFEMLTNSQFDNQYKDLDRKTTPFQFLPSTQQFNDKLTTSSIQNPTDVSEKKEYTKPLQTLTSAFPKEQFNKNENRESQLREHFNKQSTTAYSGSYTETLNNFEKEAQLTTQFNQEEFDRKTEMPEFPQTASTFGPSIYEYTKPVQYDTPLPQRETTVGVMSTNLVAPQFGTHLSQDRVDLKQTPSTQFTQGNQPSVTQFIDNFSKPILPILSQPQQGNKFNSENQEDSDEIYNYKKPNQHFSSSEQMAKRLDKGQIPFNTQFNKLKLQNKESDMPSLPGMSTTLTYQNQPKPMSITSGLKLENKYNSQEQPQQNSQSSEIYEYSKPAQTLTTPAQNNILSQHRNQQFGQRFDDVNSEPNTFNKNLSGDTSTTQNEPTSSPFMVTQTDTNSQDEFTKPDSTTITQTSFTSGMNTQPIGTRPQFAFQSACCRGLQTQKQQESQSTVPNTGSSDLKSNQNFEAQKISSQRLISTGEKFGGHRKPPSFDENGYHY